MAPTVFMYPLILFFITLSILFIVKPIVVWKLLVSIINKERDLLNMPQKDFLPNFKTLLTRIFSCFIGLICLLLAIILIFGAIQLGQ